MALSPNGGKLLVGLDSGSAEIYSTRDGSVSQTLDLSDGAVTNVQWTEERAVIATTTGIVNVIAEDGGERVKFSKHAGAVTSLAAHPSGALLASAGNDKSFIFYDLDQAIVALQVHTNTRKSIGRDSWP